jgi:aryl-alcohol dehydrogenase-like predicted oxidoreductase
MERIALNGTGLEVSRIALGTWAFGGDAVWGEQGDKESIDTVAAALDCGINFFDTAAGYAKGRSEEVLGQALVGRRDRAVIATKVHETLDRAGVIAACEASLRRLNTDYIDVYYVHWPEKGIPLAETVGALAYLLHAGKIRAAGVSNFGPLTLADLAATGDHRITLHQIPYSLFWRAIEFEILPRTKALGLTGVAYSVLAQGLLTGRYRSYADVPQSLHITRFYGDGPHGEPSCEREVFAALAFLREEAQATGISMADLAIQWVLAQPGIGVALTGARARAEIEANARALDGKAAAAILGRMTALSEAVKAKLGPNPDMWMNTQESRYR